MPFWLTFLIIAAAELGDKTQLLTLGFATKYPVWKVLAAVTAATALLMALAVIFGGALTALVPHFYLQLLAGGLFIAFGLWTLLEKEKDQEQTKAKNNSNIMMLVFSTFFLAELGDKTQLATLALAAKYQAPWQVWLGATLGMVGVNMIAALAGSWLKEHLSEKVIKLTGAIIFLLFGLATLIELFI